ncbi:hypothetical protein ACH5RR_041103 [Cinchona calisaya]|uniref:BAH domain-containing protein n=1 Tax=Cinchona calisaya TaxID=153742 RepID=A0ABD2XV71_9GENT
MYSDEVEKLGDPEFSWGKKRGVGGKKKEVQFYESFTYDGVEYALYDCVYMQNKDSEAEPYIGKLIKIWGNPDNSKKVKVQWFFRPSEISYWLQNHNVETLKNELFLASGEGQGLANVNPLEAIAGKCFVVCISCDIRNPQPSAEQLQTADYVFYRTFDVGQYIIVDKVHDKVGGLEVRFVFNRQENDTATGPKLGSKLKEDDSRIAMVYECSGKMPHEMLESINSDGKNNHPVAKEDAEAKRLMVKDETSNGHADDSVDHLKPTRGKRPASAVEVSSGEVATSISEKNNSVDVDAAAGQFKGSTLAANQRLIGEDLECQPPNLDGRPSKRTKFDNSTKVTMDKDVIKVEQSASNREDLNTSRVVSSEVKTNPNPGKNDVRVDKSMKVTKDTSNLDDRPSKRPKVLESVKLAEDKNKNNLEKEIIKSGGNVSKGSLVAASSVEDKGKSRLGQNSLRLHIEPSKEKPNSKVSKLTENLCGSEKIHIKETFEEKMNKHAKSSSKLDKGPPNKMREEKICDSNGFIGSDKASSKEKPNGKANMLMERSFGLEQGPLEEKLDGMTSMLPKNSLAKFSEAVDDVEEKIDGKIYEVTQRPKAEAGSWLSLSWEDRMVRAHEQRRLVLLQNLDPEYTSGEVEDILWNAFEENCIAKLLQQTACSCPRYGQALVIFNTREAANRVVGKLNDGCFIISNQRPLVGCISNLPWLERKQSTFVGHLTIESLMGDKIKLQMQRDKKNAVSTSHCSQPNTVEFELAMEWCLLQKRSSNWWKMLLERQAKEFKKLMSNYKSNSMRTAT